VSAARPTYAALVELVDGDAGLIDGLLAAGLLERCADDLVIVDVDRVLIARTLVRDLELDWPAVDLVLRLVHELAAARARIAALERAAER
jgi:hypothetical protein